MKKHISLIALFTAVFAVGAAVMPKSFLFQHEIGLFLWLPDYFRDVLGGSFPISTLLGDFLVQFYRIPLVGPLCTTLIVSGIFLLCRGIMKKFSRFNELFAIMLSVVAWFFIARSTTPIIGVAILLIISLIRLAVIPFKSIVRRPEPKSPVLPLAIVLLAAIIISADPVTSNIETWSRIETAARQAKWDKVLKAATPEKAAKDREMVPFALLAAGSKGQMQRALVQYTVSNPGEMDFTGVENRRGYYFQSLLNEQLGCTNEAIHNIFQCGCHMHRGTSFVVLTQLIRYNIELGNYTLVRKYSEILRHSTAYRATANELLKLYDGKADEAVDGGPAELSPSITENPMYNLVFMAECGIESPIAKDRYAAYATLLKQFKNKSKQ